MSQDLVYDILIFLAIAGKTEEDREKRWDDASQYIKDLTEENYNNLIKTCTQEERILTKMLKERPIR